MSIETTFEDFKKLDKLGVHKYGRTLKKGKTYDREGNHIVFKNDFYWVEAEYNEDGRILNIKNDTGFWWEKTYDEYGNILTYKDKNGFNYVATYDYDGNEKTYFDSEDNYRVRKKDVTKAEFKEFRNRVNKILLQTILSNEKTEWHFDEVLVAWRSGNICNILSHGFVDKKDFKTMLHAAVLEMNDNVKYRYFSRDFRKTDKEVSDNDLKWWTKTNTKTKEKEKEIDLGGLF